MVGTARRAPLPTLVLARSITLASFREEWPSLGGHPGWAADRSDRCPPKPLRAVLRSKIAIGTSSGPGWLKEPRVRKQGRVDEDGQAYHDLCRGRYRQTEARRRDRWQLGRAAD